ncbi:hypothetical protein BO71DRAFT_406176 [Aspergillus ellipticus CBS 707.79]|uniref:Cytokinesis regulator n=1 Tax=Aspergillus ellipticus CBS 707.79 TaxID=1448320 RepID=A0A319DL94_9EURO|nr:hypothetical protein BO71DRAFT_406176 [Aspergillus ellipticus CBS 707.79]
MAPLTLEVRHSEDETIECWDDDDDLQGYDDIHLRAASSATSVTTSSIRRSGHRDSISSRRSARSDIDSNAGDEDWQVQLLDNDDLVNEEAIASARDAGIPLPANVPRSALIGGTIKRLGHRKQRKDIVDDWSDDVEFPEPDGVLELRSSLDTFFPESLRQVSSAAASPVKISASSVWDSEISTRLHSAFAINATSEQDDGVGDTKDVPTIKVAKPLSPEKPSSVRNIASEKPSNITDNFESDFEFPVDDVLFRLSPRKAHLENPNHSPEDFDVDWSESSIGVRFGGTTRDHTSNPSSSVSVVSPSVSSCLTVESEDDGLDGLVIPEGPLDLEGPLKLRKEPFNQEATRLEPACLDQTSLGTDDFFSGLEIESGDVFDPRRLSINPNVKCKTESYRNPTRHSTTTITFTNTTVSPKTRIPRLSGQDRPRSTHLETVSESGALSRFRTSQRRAGGHSPQSSVSSVPSGSSFTPQIPMTPNRRSMGTVMSNDSFVTERIPPGRQLLKAKRSMPTMRNVQQSVSTTRSPPTYQDWSELSNHFTLRPKTPVERILNDTKPAVRKHQAPFLPAGASEKQSHHASVKSYRYNRRFNSDGPTDTMGIQASVARAARSNRQDNLGKNLNEISPETLVTKNKRALTRPTRRRNFGDGSELALFDDLPTSSSAEKRYVKHPSSRVVPKTLRSKLNQGQHSSPKSEFVNEPTSPGGKIKFNATPRFARDTNASRNAREQRIASMSMASALKNRDHHPLAPLGSNWKSLNTSRTPSTIGSAPFRGKRSKATSMPGCKPQLIKPMGAGVQETKFLNGMRYNPTSFCWEGNEKIIQDFDTISPKSPKPTPALITNIGAMQNVQVVGGMVFDPQRMCWLKLAPLQPGKDGLVAIRDEDDVFAGLGDLKETISITCGRFSGTFDGLGLVASGDDRSYEDSSDEWPMTEEFDVGPEFIRRQRAEEEKWRRKVDKWTSYNRGMFGDSWRWAIRDLVRFDSTIRTQDLDRT